MDEARFRAMAIRIRGLLYSWVTTEDSSADSHPILETVSLMENGSPGFRYAPLPSTISPLIPHALAFGTSPTLHILAGNLINIYMYVDNPVQFMDLVAVANLAFYGVMYDAASIGVVHILSLVTRNTLTLTKHFVDESTLHEFLRITANQLSDIPSESPFVISALCYWGLRNVAREYIRWDVDRTSAFPETRLYIEKTINVISSHNDNIDLLRTVFCVLCCWFGVDNGHATEVSSISNTIEYHILWHRVCTLGCI